MTRSMNPHPVQRLAAVAIACALALVCVSSAAAAPKIDGVFPVPGFGTNNKLVAGPDGNMWVTLSGVGNDVARITPSGEVKEFDLENVETPSGIAVDNTGNLWITQNGGVAKFSPSNPEKTVTQPIPEVKATASIVAGPDGNMWVATEGNLVHFPPADPTKFKAIPILNLAPHDIDVAGSLLVIADAVERIVTVTTSGTEVDYKIAGGSQGVAGTPGGQIAYTDALATPEQVGLITPPNPAKSTELLGDPFGVALGSDGNFWVVQFGKDGVSQLTPGGQTTFLGSFPKGSGPRQIAAGPGNTLWVGMEGNIGEGVQPAVGRITGLEPPVTTKPAPETKLAQGPKKFRTARRRARVKFRFSSTTAGAGFECALTKARKGKKNAAKPHFKACKSPKSYRLTPGRYRFSVRAVSGGVVDATPATRSFRVIHKRR